MQKRIWQAVGIGVLLVMVYSAPSTLAILATDVFGLILGFLRGIVSVITVLTHHG